MKKAVLCTLAYSDIFNYPLTQEEVWKWLISEKKSDPPSPRRLVELRRAGEENKKKFTHSLRLALNSRQIRMPQGFYHLQGREEIVKLREQRRGYSNKKLKIAEKIAGILRLIPWVKLVGVTGALAMANSDKEDDIDLLIVASKNRLWLTRALVVFLVELVAQRRRPGDQKVKDKICLNMFLDEKHLAIPKKERDLFSAHEVVQMRPIFTREKTYSRFLQENSWVEDFLPNAVEKGVENKEFKKQKIINHQSRSDKLCLSSTINHFERLAQTLQLWYMRKRRTTEIIAEGIIRFHPQDAREWVLKEYQARLKKLRIA